jgi:hypothetical protein
VLMRTAVLVVAFTIWVPIATAHAAALLINRPPDISDPDILKAVAGAYSCVLVRSAVDPAREQKENPAQIASAIRGSISQRTSAIRVVTGSDCETIEAARSKNVWRVADYPRLLAFVCTVAGDNPSCSPLQEANDAAVSALMEPSERLGFIGDALDENTGLARIPICGHDGCRPYHLRLRDLFIPGGHRVVIRLAGLLETKNEGLLWETLFTARSRGRAAIPVEAIGNTSVLRDACRDLATVYLNYSAARDEAMLTCSRPGLSDLEVSLSSTAFTRIVLPPRCAGALVHVTEAPDAVVLSRGRASHYGPVVVAYSNMARVVVDSATTECRSREKGFTTLAEVTPSDLGIPFVKSPRTRLPSSICYTSVQLNEAVRITHSTDYTGRSNGNGGTDAVSSTLELSRVDDLVFRFVVSDGAQFQKETDFRLSFQPSALSLVPQAIKIETPVPVCAQSEASSSL